MGKLPNQPSEYPTNKLNYNSIFEKKDHRSSYKFQNMPWEQVLIVLKFRLQEVGNKKFSPPF